MLTRELTVKLPVELDDELQKLAQYLDRDRALLAVKALESFVAKWKQQREELESPIDPINPESLSLDQVSDLIKEDRRTRRESKAA